MHIDDSHVTGIPHVYTSLFVIIIISAALTWVVPAGEFEKGIGEFGVSIIMPGTYREVVPAPVTPAGVLSTVYRGMVDAADTVFFIFIAFASINVMVSTGAFHALIAMLIGLFFKGRARILMIPVFITLIGMASSTIAVFEEMFPFIPLFVAVATAMRYDAIVGMSIVALGIGLGYSGAFLNPFTVGIAQDIAGLPPYSGAGYRLICHLVTIVLASAYVMIYAANISRHPERGFLHGERGNAARLDAKVLEEYPLRPRHCAVITVMIAGVSIILWGVLSRQWLFQQISAVYLGMGISSGLIMGWSPDKISHKWAEGASEITSTCIKVALAKGIILILKDAHILDTIINWIATPLLSLPRWAAAEFMLLLQTMMNFFVPSGSGQALVSMPIMVPLSDLLGISRQTTVLAFQFGDGLSNILWITGSMPIICKFAKVPPRAWLKWLMPLFFILTAAQMIFIAVALAIGY